MTDKPTATPRWVIIARLLLIVSILVFIAVDALLLARLGLSSTAGDLSRFVPADALLFVRARDLADGLGALTNSPEWKSLAASSQFAEAQATTAVQRLAGRARELANGLPFELDLEHAMVLLGRDAGVALRPTSQAEGPDWLLLCRTNLALAGTSWLASIAGEADKAVHRGRTVLELRSCTPPVSIATIGDLVLASNSGQWLRESLDLALGHRTRSFAEATQASTPSRLGHSEPGAPHLSFTLNLVRMRGPQGAGGLPDVDPSSRLLGLFTDRLAGLGAPPELLALAAVFLSNKVGRLASAQALTATAPLNRPWRGQGAVHLAQGTGGNQLVANDFPLFNTLPANAGYVSVELVDFRNWFRSVLAEEEAERGAIDAEIEQYARFLGIEDFESGLLDLFGPQVALVISPQPVGGEDWRYPLPALSAVIELKSPQKVSEFLEKSVKKAMADMLADHEAAQRDLPDDNRSDFPFAVEEMTDGQFTYSVVTMRENYLGAAFRPAYGVLGNALVFTTSSRFIRDVIQVRNAAPHPLPQNLLTELDAPFDGFWYISPPQLAEALLPTAETYIETHQIWRPEEKREHKARLREIASLTKLFQNLIFTTRLADREIGVQWSCRPASD